MCSARWHAKTVPDWWRPLPLDVRRWERSSSSIPRAPRLSSYAKGDVKVGESIELDKPAGLQGKKMEEREKSIRQSPFGEQRNPPPNTGWSHAWDMIKWGNKGGPWGQGPGHKGEGKG
jgi:peroxisome-assembly ATPase